MIALGSEILREVIDTLSPPGIKGIGSLDPLLK
jgi:hypothetical protein